MIELPIFKTQVDFKKPYRVLDEVMPLEFAPSSPNSSSALGHNVENHDNYAYSTTLYVGSNR